VILGLEYHRILKEIYDSGMFVVDFIVALLNEEQIELLYKYHVPDSLLSTSRLKNIGPGIEDYAYLLKSVPVRNWRLLRRRFELGPSLVAILRKPGESAARVLKALKGPSNPGVRRVWIGRATPLEVTLFQERSLNQHSLTKGRPSSIHDSVEADDRTTVID
jgi:hypothetical protein